MEPTQASPTALGETEWIEQPTQAAPQQAWSAATEPMLQPYRRRQVVVGLKYLLPALLVAGVALLLMGGRSDRNPYRPTPAPPSAVVVSAHPSASQDDKFVNLLEAAGWHITNRQHAFDVGRYTCKYLGEGHSVGDTIAMWDATPDSKGAMPPHAQDVEHVGAAITAYCPQFR